MFELQLLLVRVTLAIIPMVVEAFGVVVGGPRLGRYDRSMPKLTLRLQASSAPLSILGSSVLSPPPCTVRTFGPFSGARLSSPRAVPQAPSSRAALAKQLVAAVVAAVVALSSVVV